METNRLAIPKNSQLPVVAAVIVIAARVLTIALWMSATDFFSVSNMILAVIPEILLVIFALVLAKKNLKWLIIPMAVKLLLETPAMIMRIALNIRYLSFNSVIILLSHILIFLLYALILLFFILTAINVIKNKWVFVATCIGAVFAGAFFKLLPTAIYWINGGYWEWYMIVSIFADIIPMVAYFTAIVCLAFALERGVPE